ncbi:MAG: riboflavin synthase [Victivallaceae bacterium]|nr:riboflavin synthase [Victivallaceae bacterium]
MFTGLIETTGIVTGRSKNHLRVRPATALSAPQYGESVAVNGCCLTLERELAGGVLEFFTLHETLRRTNLEAAAASGATVNLERAMTPEKRFGGHLVTGHIDAAGELLHCGRTPDGDYELRIALPDEIAPEIAFKGSVAVDGVSLTVASVGDGFFTVRLIPVTLGDTALSRRKPGDLLNLESDVLAKYVRRGMECARCRKETAAEVGGGTVTAEKLREAGFEL